jgi:hypothetical protein
LDAELAGLARQIGPLLYEIARQRADLAHSERELEELAQRVDSVLQLEEQRLAREREVERTTAHYAQSVRVPDYVSPAHLAYDPGDHLGKL